jgi:hypothetical protein
LSHFLATINPEAAEAIGREPKAGTGLAYLPQVGQQVRYIPRPGEGRGGLTEFSMLVTQRREDGWLRGVCILDANDFKDVGWLPQRSITHDFPAWDWLDPTPAPGELTGSDATVIGQNRTAALVARFDQMYEQQTGMLERLIRQQESVAQVREQVVGLQQHVNRLIEHVEEYGAHLSEAQVQVRVQQEQINLLLEKRARDSKDIDELAEHCADVTVRVRKLEDGLSKRSKPLKDPE